jgi:hypothetical protein
MPTGYQSLRDGVLECAKTLNVLGTVGIELEIGCQQLISADSIRDWLESAGINRIEQDADWMTFYTTVETANEPSASFPRGCGSGSRSWGDQGLTCPSQPLRIRQYPLVPVLKVGNFAF